ncbi:fibronectin type III domain-containing protein [Sediminitomix flava]|uniref:Putative secreted protein (Por secretion system target) n=1 Tax=Sediminitomix flava TaxID=379075 RepID=A0A315Z4T7_SEDFL|nr:fibronectin type III domain-containing protein [Sediminitomix flava]PWJ38498.1 putative secreted protein (Por secretion system target) [Sediminitomix flava]
MKNVLQSCLTLLLVIGFHLYTLAQSFDYGNGKTSLIIGQTFQQEYIDYINGIGTAPAGSSHYAELYSGTINQGDDGVNFDDSSPYLTWVNDNYPGATILIAISIKDNPGAGGYGELNPNSSNYDPNGVYKATKDIAYTTKWDAEIAQLANKFKSFPNLKFMVRLGYEVSLLAMGNAAEGMEFGDVLNIYNDQGVNIYDLPKEEFYNTVSKDHIDVDAFPDAYNKMAQIIREQEGATNVKFVYHPVRGFGEVKLLYPGDEYVDYIAFSIFNHDISMGTDESIQVIREIGSNGSRLDGNLEQSLDWSTAKKPVIIAESAYQNAPAEWKDYISSPYDNPFIEYLDRLLEVVENYDIRSLAYINSDWQSHGWPEQWADSRVEAFADVKAYWMENVINNSRYVQYNGQSPEPSCADGIQNGDETGIDCGGSCAPCDPVSETVPNTPSALVSTSKSADEITLSWTDNSDNEDGFYVTRNGVQYATIAPNTTSFTDTGLSASTTYTYQIKAYNAEGNSANSNSVAITTDDISTPPPSNNCPTSHPYEACGNCWENAAQAESAGCTEDPNTGNPDNGETTPPASSNCPSSHPYEACGQCWEDGQQAASSGCTETPEEPVETAPNTPSGLSASVNGTSVTVRWNSVSNADSYTLKYGTASQSYSQTLNGLTGTSRTISNLQELTTYYFTVNAVNSVGSSADASEVSAFVDSTATTPPDETNPPVDGNEDGKAKAKFTASTGQTLLILGQDLGSVAGYVNSGKFPEIGGVTQYTNIYDLAGLETTTNYGAGDLCLQCALDSYPNSTLSIGLYMVEDNDGKGNPDRLGRIDHPNGLTDIVNGLYDIELQRIADFFNNNADRPIFLRIGYEFDGEWNHYEPSKYIAAYKYLVDYMNAQNVENVAYVWQSATYGTTYNGLPISSWYPGDAYVDYLGLSFFFFDEGFNGPNLNYMLDLAREKQIPIMMAEVSAQYYDLELGLFHPYNSLANPTAMTGEEIWNQYWVDQLLPFIHNNEDVIRSVAYINADWQSQEMWRWPDAGNGFWGDTRIETNDYVSQQWAAELAKDSWIHGSENLFAILKGDTTGTVPNSPTGLNASASGNTISLSWNEVSNADSYTVSYGTSSGVYTTAKNVNSTSTSISNLFEGTTYYFVVSASNSVGESNPSSQVSATTETGVTPPPPSDKIEGKFTPADGKTLLAIGQDLFSLAGYRYGDVMPDTYDFGLQAGEGGMPEPGAAVAYIAFYMLTLDQYGINYGATGMDNGGNLTGVDTDWGAGPLNAASVADGWDHSALIMAMSITENWNLNGLQGIANGQYEANIDKLALFCNSYPNKKIYLRIGYEFEGRWNSEDTAGGDYPGGYHKQEEYKAAWRHIVEGMRSRGVTNVAYVWQASASPVDDVLDAQFAHGGDLAAAREDITGWYPGDDVVDWFGISWFIAPQEADDFFGFNDVPNLPNQDDLANEMLAFARERNKPVMIAESTPQGYDLEISEYDNTPSMVSRAATGWTYEGAQTLFTEGLAAAEEQFAPGTWFDNFSAETAWNRWYEPFLNYIYDNQDVIRAVTYINADWNQQSKWASPYNEGYWGDTRVEANTVIKSKWLEETNKDFWLLGSTDISSKLLDAPAARQAIQKIQDLEEGNDILLFPNPVKTVLNVSNSETVSTLTVFNLQGKLMLKGNGNSIDVSHLSSGVYVIKIDNEQPQLFIKE